VVGGPQFVKPEERIAVFDNDGTLWSEQPMYFQLAFVLDRLKAMAPQHPEWKNNPLIAAVLAGDMKTVAAEGVRGILELATITHAGMTTDQFAQIVRDWFARARHPKFNRPYTDVIFQPMLELLAYLRANGFKTFVVSGGGVEFMRVCVEKIYGIPPEQVIWQQHRNQVRNACARTYGGLVGQYKLDWFFVKGYATSSGKPGGSYKFALISPRLFMK
jgi:phosphoglycolate phosphatase-like HAD superfamily hydrolase